MNRFFAALLFALAPVARPFPSAADELPGIRVETPAQWRALLDLDARFGTLSGDHSRQDLIWVHDGAPPKPHQKDIISQSIPVTNLMFEDWRIKDGNWEIEMWRFVLGPDGNAVDVVHRTLGEDFSGTTLTEEWDRGVTVQDERAQTALRAMFDRWAKFSPQ